MIYLFLETLIAWIFFMKEAVLTTAIGKSKTPLKFFLTFENTYILWHCRKKGILDSIFTSSVLFYLFSYLRIRTSEFSTFVSKVNSIRKWLVCRNAIRFWLLTENVLIFQCPRLFCTVCFSICNYRVFFWEVIIIIESFSKIAVV